MRFMIVHLPKADGTTEDVKVLCEFSRVIEVIDSDAILIDKDIFGNMQTFVGLVKSVEDAKYKYPEEFL